MSRWRVFVDEVLVEGLAEVQLNWPGYAAALRPQLGGVEPPFERFDPPRQTVTFVVTDPSMVAALHGRALLAGSGLRVSLPEPAEPWCDAIEVDQGFRFPRGTL